MSFFYIFNLTNVLIKCLRCALVRIPQEGSPTTTDYYDSYAQHASFEITPPTLWYYENKWHLIRLKACFFHTRKCALPILKAEKKKI